MTDSDQPTDTGQETVVTSTSPAPAPKRTKKSTATREPRVRKPSDVELRFTGDATRDMRGVPARDLTQAEVDRLVYRRTVPEPGSPGMRRGDGGFSNARAKVVREVLATGSFKKRS